MCDCAAMMTTNDRENIINEVKFEKLKFVKICDEFLVKNVRVSEFCWADGVEKCTKIVEWFDKNLERQDRMQVHDSSTVT